jgi:hypothetical protein
MLLLEHNILNAFNNNVIILCKGVFYLQILIVIIIWISSGNVFKIALFVKVMQMKMNFIKLKKDV